MIGGDGADTLDLAGRGTVVAGAGDDRIEGRRTAPSSAGPAPTSSPTRSYRARGVLDGDCEQVVEEFTRIPLLRFGPRAVVLAVARRDAAVCAVRARLRVAGAGAGRVLAQRTSRVRRGRVAPIRLRAERALPARVRVELRPLVCPGGRAPRVDDDFLAESFPLQRTPLALAPGVG